MVDVRVCVCVGGGGAQKGSCGAGECKDLGQRGGGLPVLLCEVMSAAGLM